MKRKSYYLIFLSKILCFVALFSGGAAAQAENSLLTPLQTSGYNLGALPFTLRVPFSSKQEVDSLKVQILDVSRGQLREPKYIEAFSQPSLRPADERGVPVIEIQVDPAKLAAQGTYTLYLVISGAGGQQFLSIQLMRPAAKIIAPPPLNVVQEYLPFFAASSSGQPLVVEVQGDAPISELKIIQQEFSNPSGDTSNAQIEFEPIKETLAAGNPLKAAYKLNGDFPLGKNAGKIRLSSPQMSEPLLVNFEVVSRRSRFLIIAFLLLGLVAGYFLRIYLKKFIERREARGKALVLEEKLAKLAEHADEKFKNEIKRALELKASKENSVEKINTAIAAASKILTDAQTDLDERKKAAVAEYNALANIAGFKTQMPTGISELLVKLETAIKSAASLLEKEDVESFRQNLETAKKDFAENLKSAVGESIRQTENILDALNDAAIFSAAVAEKITAADTQIRAKIVIAEELTASLETPAANDLKTGLTGVYEIREELRGLLVQMTYWLSVVRDETVNTLRLEKIKDETAIAVLDDRVRTLNDFLKSEAAISAPNAAGEIVQMKPALARAWREAIEKQAPPNLSETDKLRLDTELDAYNYVKAAQIVAELNKKPTEFLGRRDEAMALDAPFSSLILSDYFAANKFLPESADFLIFNPARTDESLEDSQKRNAAELWYAKLAQTAIIGFGILLIGYLLFTDAFIGTIKELALIFFWAFGLDVSLDNLVDKATGLKK